METWKNLLKKAIRYFLSRENNNCWGMNGAIGVMLESRQQVKEKVNQQKQWQAQHRRRRELFEQLKNGKNINEE